MSVLTISITKCFGGFGVCCSKFGNLFHLGKSMNKYCMMVVNYLIDWYNMYRDLMSRDMLKNPLVLGGPGVVVQMDESKFSGKRKYNSMPPNRPWVFVPNRTQITLTEKIEQHVAPGCTLHTDMWAGYLNLANHPNGYVHEMVNHTEQFVDPATGVHTQMIEGFWGMQRNP